MEYNAFKLIGIENARELFIIATVVHALDLDHAVSRNLSDAVPALKEALRREGLDYNPVSPESDCDSKDPDRMCPDCKCWKQTRANCS